MIYKKRMFNWHPKCRIQPASHQITQTCNATNQLAVQAIVDLKTCVQQKISFEVTSDGSNAKSDTSGIQQLFCTTSGTTSAPKVIARSAESWIKSFEVNNTIFGFCETDRFAVFGNLSHSLTLYAVLEAAHLGADITTFYGMRPDRQMDLLSLSEVNVLYLTPTQLGGLIAHNLNVPEIRKIMVGGGTLSPQLRATAATTFPNADIFAFYGASEASFISIADPNAPASSVGKPYPGVQLKVDASVGEIWVQSPYLFDGYASGQSQSTRWQDGYLTVGELGYLDENGYLFLLGRRERMVTVSDQNVFLDAVEAFFKAQIASDAIVVVASKCTKRGHELHLIVIGDANVEVALKACRTELGATNTPRKVHRIEEMPLLGSGKPDLKRLQQDFGGCV